MTASARTALINIGTRRQGATLGNATPITAIEELQKLGYLGTGGGLTRKGSIEREAILTAELDALFG